MLHDQHDWVARFVDSRRVAIASTRFGGSLNVFDVLTGELLRSHRPFYWTVWHLPCVLVGYAVWCHFFLVHRAHASGSAWVDVAVVFGLPLAISLTCAGRC
jgi:hypothetical protein